MGRSARVFAVAALLGTWLAAGPHTTRARPAQTAAVAQVTPEQDDGLRFRLSQADPERDASAPLPRPPTSPLDPGRTSALLESLPPLAAEPGDEPDTVLREASLPPPRAGRTVNQPFPPADERERPGGPQSGPLEVLRRQPEGDVPLAPHVSVTFSQPMVAVTSHEELSGQDVPVRLTPEPAGRWRWVGTRTLLFEAVREAMGETEDAAERGRLPMATDYTVEVPAGTRSATGGVLKQAARWTFRTPAPRLVQREPVNRSAVREPVLFAEFDQAIDADAVLAALRVEAGGSDVPVRRASSEDVEADDHVRPLARAARPGRWLAFRPERPLPADSAVTVTVPAGTPSGEGPRTTADAQAWSFRTFGPLRVVEHHCGWNGECPPGAPWRVRFSNALDPAAATADLVRISPDLPAALRTADGDLLWIRARARGRTTYTVTLDGALRDVFGQTLGEDTALTFTTTATHPQLWSGAQGLVVLDPAAGPALSVFTVNHKALKVRAHAVAPRDWPAFQRYMQVAWRDDRDHALPGRPVLERTVAVEARDDEMVETRVDLAPALSGGLGQVVVEVEPTVRPPRQGRQAVRAWVQATRIGLTAFGDPGHVTAWATSLSDGRPLDGVEVSLAPSGTSSRTGRDGTTRLALGEASLLVARRGADVAILPREAGWWGGEGWRRHEAGRRLRAFVFDDRGMYKPGEEARLKGWLRVMEPGPLGDLSPVAGEVPEIGYVLKDSQGNEVLRGTRQVDAWGGFDLSLSLPGTMNLGPAWLTLKGTGAVASEFQHALQVQEFRRPEFEVGATASAGPHLVGGGAVVTARAAYYAGGALPDAEVRWEATARPASFTPPNRDDFTFGRWTPWWRPFDDHAETSRTETLSGRTGPDGQHRLRIDLDAVRPPRASHLAVQATVTDVNRQAWTASAQLLVHPALVYVGLRSPRPFVQAGQAIAVEGVVVDLDGGAVPGRAVELVAERLAWEQSGGEWREVPKDPQGCEATSSADVFRCEFTPVTGGSWRVRARTTDGQGRPNESELRVFVAGGDAPPSRGLEREDVTLLPGQPTYRPGEVAEILVAAPFAPAEGVLTLQRSGLVRSERFRMDAATHTLRIPIEAAWVPNVTVQVDLVGAAVRTGEDGRPDARRARRPAFATGSLALKIPPAERTLAVAVTPRDKELDPGKATEVELQVADAAGRPVRGAQVALVVADEAVLALSGYKLADPIAAFYADRSPDVTTRHNREHVVLARADEVEIEGGVVGGAMGDVRETIMVEEDRLSALGYLSDGRALPAAPPAQAPKMRQAMKVAATDAAPAVQLRSDFRPLAHFDPAVVTDAAGRARIPVTFPESLSRFRVMAVAATRQQPGQTAQFGAAEDTVTVRLPLMVRPSPPRFLNFGDRFELPVVVQNQTRAPLSVEVAVRAANAEPATGEGRRVDVPANDRVEVRFPAAARRPGTARFQMVAVSGAHSDAAEVSLPVWTPATTEAFATYGHLDAGTLVQPIRAPRGVVPRFGGLEVTTSSTALQSLTDAVLYLVSYPFECTEQVASRLLAVAALRDVLAAFQARGLPPPEELLKSVERDVQLLERVQNEDGGWAFWRRGDPSWPYLGIHVAHALQRARAKGFSVPDRTLEAARTYLREIERHVPEEYGQDVCRTLIAYALYVRGLMGDGDAARARRLIAEAGGVAKLGFEALGWLLPVMTGDTASAAEVAAIRRHLRNNVTETAAAAHFAAGYGDGAHLLLWSDRRADAVVLDALIASDPGSDLIAKLVAGLLAHRRAGRWENTQENAFVLLALDRYFQAYEKATPDFVARLWLGERYAGEQAFRGRSSERRHVEIPMRELGDGGTENELLLAKEGTGRLYYRIGMRYAPADLELAPADHGFTVERAYEGADDPADVRREPDGTWRIRAGARVRVELTMVAPARRYHVALVDPLPAGLEPLNPALAVTGAVPAGPKDDVVALGAPGLGGPGHHAGGWWWWRGPWYEHQNLRDDRAEAFTSLLWEGVWTYAYAARATTPGRFVVPPPKAEEMYHPETFGRGATAIVTVQ